MSVTVTSPISPGYVANGVTTAFGFDFKIASASEIRVYQVLAGVETTINPGDYSVALAADGEGGTVIFDVAPSIVTGTIYIASDPLFTQTTALGADGPFTPNILNDIIDRAAIRDIYLKRKAEDLAAAVADRATLDDLATITGFNAIVLPDTVGGLYPEQFGAIGDGITNDTAAFQALATYINAASGGTIVLRPGATYLVGLQSLVNSGGIMWAGEDVLTISGCTRPVTIRGNGAIFKLAPNLKVGTFNAAGASTTQTLPYNGGERSQPVPVGIIDIRNCTSSIYLENFEVNGNEANLNWGGPFGNTGWQLGGDGIYLLNNTGGEHLVNVHSHDCPRDCININGGPVPFGPANRRLGSTATGCRFIRSVRQGMSLTGGSGWTFVACVFLDTGLGSHASAPIAGIDLEAEGGAIIRDIHFINCEIGNTNNGAAALSVGDVEGVSFDHCRFIGSTSWTLYGWQKAQFDDCWFIGSMTNLNNNRFNRCILSDDSTLSPVGTVFLSSGHIPDFGGDGSGNVFDECEWRLVGGGSGGYGSAGTWTCRNCKVGYGPTAPSGSFMQPRWEGINILGPGFVHINPADMGPIALGGDIILNGVSQLKGSKVYDPANIASGANLSTTVTVPYARMGDYAKASFSLDLQGVVLDAYVSAAGTVTVYFTNKTGGGVNLASGTLEVRVHDHTAA